MVVVLVGCICMSFAEVQVRGFAPIEMLESWVLGYWNGGLRESKRNWY